MFAKHPINHPISNISNGTYKSDIRNLENVRQIGEFTETDFENDYRVIEEEMRHFEVQNSPPLNRAADRPGADQRSPPPPPSPLPNRSTASLSAFRGACGTIEEEEMVVVHGFPKSYIGLFRNFYGRPIGIKYMRTDCIVRHSQVLIVFFPAWDEVHRI